ncbi:MAG: hypothetical protein WCE30_17360, partial [Mycobacterium sp.]
MQTAVRPRLTTGIAALGASAIIATTVTVTPHHVNMPALPDLPGVTTSVELASLVNPFSAIGQIVQSTVTDVQQLVSGLSANPFPIAGVVVPQTINTVKQLLSTGESAISGVLNGLAQDIPSSIQSFIQYARAGNWETALGYILTPLVGIGINLYGPQLTLTKILSGPFIAAANVIQALPGVILQTLANGLISPVANVLQSVGLGIDTLGAAIKSGNLGNVYNAVVNSAVNITNTVIGTLVGPNGIIAGLLNVRTTIAQALAQTSASSAAAAAAAAAVKPTSTAAALPASSTKSLTLSATAT